MPRHSSCFDYFAVDFLLPDAAPLETLPLYALLCLRHVYAPVLFIFIILLLICLVYAAPYAMSRRCATFDCRRQRRHASDARRLFAVISRALRR